MPFELGIDLGCRYYHPDLKFREKKFLVLEQKLFDTKIVLSDLSFADCESHEGDPEKLVEKIRDWIVSLGIKKVKPATVI